MQHASGSRIATGAISIALVLSLVSAASASSYDGAGGERWIVVASGATPDEARDVARAYRQTFSGTEIHQTRNGYYAVSIGHEPLASAMADTSELIYDGTLPPDSFLSDGTSFVSELPIEPAAPKSASGGQSIVVPVLLAGAAALILARLFSGSGSSSGSSGGSGGGSRHYDYEQHPAPREPDPAPAAPVKPIDPFYGPSGGAFYGN